MSAPNIKTGAVTKCNLITIRRHVHGIGRTIVSFLPSKVAAGWMCRALS